MIPRPVNFISFAKISPTIRQTIHVANKTPKNPAKISVPSPPIAFAPCKLYILALIQAPASAL